MTPPPRSTATADLALRAPGPLGRFNAAGVLAPADVHVATRLGALFGEADEDVLLAVALTVRSTRNGSVVTDLANAATSAAANPDDAGPDPAATLDLLWPDVARWIEACAASPLMTGPHAPVCRRGTRLWLARYDAQEQLVADELLARTSELPGDLDLSVLRRGLDRLFPTADADQRLGAAVCALSRVSVLAGGPGTGKTTTVSRVLALLAEQHPEWRITLTAPTGKAAARLDEAVADSTARLADAGDRERLGGLEGVTLHRLLGWKPGSRSRFRHDRTNRLPYEVVVVDEASMVPLTMMARLLEALRPSTRLLLVGDPDQLASVEAGAVLGDLVDRSALGSRTPAMVRALDAAAPKHGSTGVAATPSARVRDGIATLTVNHRFDAATAIGALADAVRAGRVDDALGLLRSRAAGVEFVEVADGSSVDAGTLAAVEADVVGWGAALRAAALAGNHDGALEALARHRLLCAHRRGPRGVQHWESLALRWLITADPALLLARADGHYPGEPLLVTTNDYEIGLFNGDAGVVVADPAGGRALTAWFSRGRAPVGVPLVRLGEVRPVHAMTVHRSQGSQFDGVTVVLPTADSPLASRETLYTAITRAVKQVRVIGSVDAFRAAVARPAARATGLRERLSS